jgi:hypothetical protein
MSCVSNMITQIVNDQLFDYSITETTQQNDCTNKRQYLDINVNMIGIKKIKINIKDKKTTYEMYCNYRVAKCEITSELLSELWHVNTYNLQEISKQKWNRYIGPLINKGIDIDLVNQDLWMSINS